MSREPGEAEPQGEPTDGELVARVLSGRTEAYSILVTRYESGLFRHARAMGIDRDTAADLVQDALIRAYERLGECLNPQGFRTWVGRILRNRCLDHLKRPATRRRQSISVYQPATDDPAQAAEIGAVREALETALGALPAEQREAFVLKHVEGWSYEEMAEVATVSVSAMKMRVHRARESLRAQLQTAGIEADG